MTRPIRILHIEDLKSFRDLTNTALEESGHLYKYDSAQTRTETMDKIAKHFFHILIVDISLEQGENYNSQGLEIVKELLNDNLLNTEHDVYSPMRAVILSLFGDRLDWLKEVLSKFNVMAFFDKRDDFDTLTFGDELQRVFNRRLSINLDLPITWQGEATGYITEKMQHLNLEDKPQDEIEDLLCRLYASDTDEVIVTGTGDTEAGNRMRFNIQHVSGDVKREEVVLCEAITLAQHKETPAEMAVSGKAEVGKLRTTPHLRGKRFC